MHQFFPYLALFFLIIGLLQPSPATYTGTIASVDPSQARIIIDRDAVRGGPVTRMAFVYVGRRDLQLVAAQQRVGFAAREADEGFELTGIWPLPARRNMGAGESEEKFGHHHNPHHGGFVGMVGNFHVEAVASRDGVVRAYVSDFSRRPLPLRGFFGKATLHDGDKAVVRAMGRMSTNTGPALGTRFDEFEAAEVLVEFDLVRGDDIINIEFLLPLERAARRKPVMPKRCDSEQNPNYYAVSKPWCFMDFGRAVAALALSPKGDYFAVAPVDLPVTAWALPDGKRLSQFKPAPDVPPAPGHHEHADAPNAIVSIPPDGLTAVVVLENRFLRYAVDNGRLLGELAAADGLVMDAQRPAAVQPLLASVSYRKQLVRIGEDDDATTAFASMASNISAFTVSFDGARVAVADESGVVKVFEAADDRSGVEMSTRLARIASLVFAGDYLAAASKDGVVRVWHATTGGQVGERLKLEPQLRIAADHTGRRLLTGDSKGGLQLFTVPALRPGLAMKFHRAAITALAWSGESIASGDEAGAVAVWRFSPPKN
jgi:hypothetical protein